MFKNFLGTIGFSGTNQTQRRKSPTKPIGVPGYVNYSGYLTEFEKNPKLAGRQKYITYSDVLANDATVSASVRYTLNLARSAAAEYSIVPADDTRESEEIAEKFEQIFKQMDTPLDRVVTRAVMFKYYGFSIQEWTLKRIADDIIGLADIAPRAQNTIERWDTTYHGDVNGAVQRSPQDSQEIYLPRNRLLYLVDDSLNDSPEGLGLFRHVVRLSEHVAKMEGLEGQGYENGLRGMPLVRGPVMEQIDAEINGNTEKAGAMKSMFDALRGFMTNHAKEPSRALLLDSQPYETIEGNPTSHKKFDLEIVKGPSEGEREIDEAIKRKQREIARTLGTEAILLGDGAGSHALSKDKNNQLNQIVDGALSAIAIQTRKDVMQPVMRANKWPLELTPEIRFGKLRNMSFQEAAAGVRDVTVAGVTISNDDELVSELFNMAGLTPPQGMGLGQADINGLGENQDQDDVSVEGE